MQSFHLLLIRYKSHSSKLLRNHILQPLLNRINWCPWNPLNPREFSCCIVFQQYLTIAIGSAHHWRTCISVFLLSFLPSDSESTFLTTSCFFLSNRHCDSDTSLNSKQIQLQVFCVSSKPFVLSNTGEEISELLMCFVKLNKWWVSRYYPRMITEKNGNF